MSSSQVLFLSFEEIEPYAGIKEEYFYIKQVHALRHVGAHYWLNRTNYNHVIVSRIGGWKSVQTLIDCYGQPDEDYIIKFLTTKSKADEFIDNR